MDWIAVSRAVNRLTGGRPGEMLCARAYRRDWRLFVAVMDAAAWIIWRECEHCRTRWHRENV